MSVSTSASTMPRRKCRFTLGYRSVFEAAAANGRVHVYGRLAPDDAGLAPAADALDLSIKREVFGIALVRRLRRACCGRRVGWICRLCSRMADVAVPVSAV